MESWREELYLEHHGIDGQVHGIRNGPPYPLKPEQYSAKERKAAGLSLKKIESSSIKYEESTRKNKRERNRLAKKIKKMKDKRIPTAQEIAKKMSDAELKDAIDRKKKEKEFVDLSSKTWSDGKNFVLQTMNQFGTTAFQSFTNTFAENLGKASANKLIDELLGTTYMLKDSGGLALLNKKNDNNESDNNGNSKDKKDK